LWKATKSHRKNEKPKNTHRNLITIKYCQYLQKITIRSGNLQLRTEKMWKPRTTHRNLIVIKYCQLLTETYDLLGATSWKPTITHRNLQLLVCIYVYSYNPSYLYILTEANWVMLLLCRLMSKINSY
jgi:hypothetical protein